MKKLSFLVAMFSMAVVISCNNSADTEEEVVDSVEIAPVTYMWQAEPNDSTGELEMRRERPAGLDSLAAEPVIEFLNQTNPNVQLQYVRSSGDTIYVKIPEPGYLTQQMGSSGPQYFIATVVYNLTEIPGINFVNFDFEEGDHASPGTYRRQWAVSSQQPTADSRQP